MTSIRQLPPPATFTALHHIELVLIAAMAVLLPFDHWFFGHIVNPAPMRVLGFVLCGVWMLQIALGQSRFRLQFWHVTVVIFVAVCFFSAVYSPPIPNPKIDSLRYKLIAATKIAAAMLFLVLACQAFDKKKITLFLRTHVIVGIVVCVVSLTLYALHMSGIYSHGFALWVEKDIYNFVRIQGVSPEPHRFGAYTMTLIPWLILPQIRVQLNISNRYALPALIVIFISMMLSYSVATYIALPFLFLFLAMQSKEMLLRMIRVGAAAAILLVIALQIPSIQHGTQEIIDVKIRGDSYQDRKYQWQIAVIETWLQPWTGVGPEAYSYFIGVLDPQKKHATPASNPPQSMLFGIMANTGLPGLGSFLVFMITFLVSYIRRYRIANNDRMISHAAIAIAISHFIYQQSIWLPWSLNQWLFMALAWAALSIPNRSEAAPNQ